MNLDIIANYLVSMAMNNPKLFAAMGIMYLVGIGAKIVRSSVEEFVLKSPSQKDDEKLAKIESSKIFKAVFFVMDLFLRLKKPEQK